MPKRDRTPRLKGVINTIVGGFIGGFSSSARKWYLRTINSIHTGVDRGCQQLPPITFTNQDFVKSDIEQNDPMVITIEVSNFVEKKVLIDQGNSADILNIDSSALRTISVCHLIVVVDTSYNVLIGRSTLNALSAIVSTPQLIMKFPSPNGQVVTIKTNQKMSRQCYVDSLRVSTKPSKEDNISTHVEILTDIDLDPKLPIDEGAEPIEKLEYIPLTNEEHCTQIGERMQGPHLKQLVSTLQDHTNLFAWQPFDMPRIDLNIICHYLALCAETKPVAQRKRKIRGDRQKAI
ncbi:hypothetical protein CR513_23130, partial [Mucuna pruriens]